MMFFDRKYILTIGKRGQDGIVITDLQFTFTVTRTLSKEPNKMEGDIYNLSPESRKHFTKDNSVKVEVAYGDQDYSTLFIGNLVNVSTTLRGTDVITHFDAGDAYVSLRDGRSSRVFPANTTVETVIRDCAKDMNLAVGAFDNGSLGNSAGLNRKFKKGYSIIGTSKNILDNITRSNGLTYIIQEGTLSIVPVGDPNQEGVLLIDPTTGLIGSPEAITIELNDQKKNTKSKEGEPPRVELKKTNGIKYKTLMNPELRLSRRVKVESRFINHIVTNQKVVHKGDYRGNEWSTECEALI